MSFLVAESKPLMCFLAHDGLAGVVLQCAALGAGLGVAASSDHCHLRELAGAYLFGLLRARQ